MFRNLFQNGSRSNIGRHRSLIEALFGVKNESPSENCDPCEEIEWTWDNAIENDFVVLLNNNRDVKFHRNISSGTAVVRGTQPMSKDQYFWEVKMISPVYGTDMMVGIGTAEADMNQVHDKFLSLLGNDNKTWGLSYTGLFHHNREAKDYSTRFGQGTVIGIHLDMWNGTLSFYKNKKHLGIASRGLKGKTMYAMASSTAACSGMRIIRSCSFPSSLQFLCCTKLRELIPDEKDVLREIDLPPGLRVFLENNLGWLFESRYTETVVPQCMPSPRRMGHWGFGLDSVSEILLPVPEDEIRSSSPIFHEPSNQNIIVLEGGPLFLCSCNRRNERSSLPPPPVRRFALQEPTVLFPRPSFIEPPVNPVMNVNLNDYIQEHSGSYMPQQFLRQNVSFDTEPHNYVSGSSRSEREADRVEAMDDDGLIESEVKRRRCSYNYAIGLSDPDSE